MHIEGNGVPDAAGTVLDRMAGRPREAMYYNMSTCYRQYYDGVRGGHHQQQQQQVQAQQQQGLPLQGQWSEVRRRVKRRAGLGVV